MLCGWGGVILKVFSENNLIRSATDWTINFTLQITDLRCWDVVPEEHRKK